MALFVTLSVVSPPKTRRRRKNVPAVSAERVALSGAVSFYRLTTQSVRGEIPWERIADAAGTLRTCMLLPKGMSPDETSGVRAFVPQTLPLLLLFNAGLCDLRARGLPAQETQVTVIDERAVLADRIDCLAPFAGTLRVCTAKPERFFSAQRRLLEQNGLSLCLSGMAAPLPDSGVLFAQSCARAPRLFRGLMFTCERRRFLRAETVVGTDLVLPPAFETLREPEIDRIQFAAALYERCGVKELENLKLTFDRNQLTADC